MDLRTGCEGDKVARSKPENIYTTGADFARMFGRMEHALKRSGYLKADRKDAQADWAAYAKSLGAPFFDMVVANGIAKTLIGEPPRKLLADGLEWGPEHPAPLKNVAELIIEGVCRVRNSLIHGEKFVATGQWERDGQLVRDAFAVLIAAAEFAGPIKESNRPSQENARTKV